MWVGDVGQDLWEEVDLVTKGGNYGWSVREGAHHYKPGPDGAQYIDPVMEYPHRANHEIAMPVSRPSDRNCVIGGYVYRGEKYPSLEGVYIYADFSPGIIYGFRYDPDAHKVSAEGTLLDQKKSISSFAEDRKANFTSSTSTDKSIPSQCHKPTEGGNYLKRTICHDCGPLGDFQRGVGRGEKFRPGFLQPAIEGNAPCFQIRSADDDIFGAFPDLRR